MDEFKATPSRPMMIGGIICVILMLGSAAGCLAAGIAYRRADPLLTPIMYFASFVSLLLMAGIALFIPLGYRVTPTELIVRRWGPKVVIPIAEIGELRRVTLKKVVRVFGGGGVFGSWGLFRTFDKSNGFADFKAYMTRGDTEIAIFRKNGDVVVVSPDEPDAFIRAIEKLKAA